MTNISRRHFIEDSVLASFSACAAATLAGGTFVQPVFAQKPVSPNEQLGVVIVGSGGRGHVLGHFFAKDKRTKIIAFTDPELGRARTRCNEIEKKFGYRPEAAADFRPFLENPSVDIVACASTNHWHALSTIWALQAGKHCYTEKPFTYNLHESKALVAAAKKYGLVVQVGTQSRSTTNINAAAKWIRDGKIGEVKFVRGICYNRRKAIGPLGDYPVPQGVDYDLWCGPAPAGPLTRPNFQYDGHWQRLYGNGDLGNQGSHQFDVARCFLGVERYPNSAITYGGRVGYDIETKTPGYVDAGDVANTSVSIFDFGDKSLVFEVRALPTGPYRISGEDSPGLKVGAIAYGSDGYVVQGGVEYKTPIGRQAFSLSYAFDKNAKLVEEFKSAYPDGRPLSEFDTAERHVVNFIDAVVANDPKAVTADARSGDLSVALVHLGNMSYYLGDKNLISTDQLKKAVGSIKSLDDNEATLARTLGHLETNGVDLKKTALAIGPMLKLDVEKETFIDNPEATAMMTREDRKGYVVPSPEKV